MRSRCILYEYKYEHERLCTSTVHTAESSTPSQRQIRRVMIPYQPKWATALVVVLLLAGGHPSCASHEMEMEVSMKSLYCWKLHLFPKVAEMIPRSLHHPRPRNGPRLMIYLPRPCFIDHGPLRGAATWHHWPLLHKLRQPVVGA